MKHQVKTGLLFLVIGVCALTLVLLAACKPPPVKVGPPGPVSTTIPTIPTKPVPTDRPISVRVCIAGQRCILWLSRTGTYYVHGPVDPNYAPALCQYRPDLGDAYYSEANGQVLTPPAGCPA